MQVVLKDRADEDLSRMDAALRKFFIKHAKTLSAMPPMRHLRLGIPFNVEDVTRKARMIYEIEGGVLFVLRCFATPKEYEKWYKSFK